MTSAEAEQLKRAFVRWAGREPSVLSLAVVGSWARGTAREGSDLDLLALTGQVDRWASDDGWLRGVLARSGFVPTSVEAESHGMARSWRARAGHLVEVETTLAAPGWASSAPVDSGTRRVVEGGRAVLVDCGWLLRAVRDAVSGPSSA